MEYHSEHISDLAEFVPRLIDFLGNRKKIALYGDLGAGKTTFVKAFCAHLGVKESTSSPSFSLINEYSYGDAAEGFSLIHHLDLYRLENVQEALDIGVEDILYDPWYCLIEWPQLIESLLPEDTVKIQIDIAGETQRHFQIL